MMLGRFSEVLQSAADVLAPPPSRLEDFEYHWKMVVNFYRTYDESGKLKMEDTRLPHHLHQMLQLLAEEQGGAAGACLQAVLRRRVALPDALAALARADRPPGARAAALRLAAALLRRLPSLRRESVYRPLQRMLVQCSESAASPTEREEVELLLTLCGLVRQEPGLADVFTSPHVEASLLSVPEDIRQLFPFRSKTETPKKNPLFEVDLSAAAPRVRVAIVPAPEPGGGSDDGASAGRRALPDDSDKFLLIDLLLAYLHSADNQVVLRACEGIMIVSSLPEDDIANLVTASPACERVVEQLLCKFRAVPHDLDPADVDRLNITWAYVSPEFCEQTVGRCPGGRQLTAFFSWLDYCDTLMKECHRSIAAHLARVFRSHFLERAAEALGGSARRALLATALLAKSLRVVDSADLINEFSNWLVGEGQLPEWPLLLALVDNCLSDDHDLTLETLRFFEVIIEKGTEHSMDRLVLSRVCGPPEPEPLQDERDRLNDLSFSRERELNRDALPRRVGELLRAPGAAPPPPALQRDIARNKVSMFEAVQWCLCACTAAGTRGVCVRALQPVHVVSVCVHCSRYTWCLCACTAAGTRGVCVRALQPVHVVFAWRSFLLLLPRELLSDPLGADYEQYVHDAERHYQLWLDVTAPHGWRRAGAGAAPPDGPLLRALLRLLGGMAERPYRVNLHATALAARLALLPHAGLAARLLPPGRALLLPLRRVAAQLRAALPPGRHTRRRLARARSRLLGDEPSDDRGENNQLLETLIVLEEFCKELAAIIFVKHQHQQQQQQQQLGSEAR
ncbi:protein FAM160B1-like [Pararge aegeria]|nr:protein FAM160B1-like [Pararge aegeria]